MTGVSYGRSLKWDSGCKRHKQKSGLPFTLPVSNLNYEMAGNREMHYQNISRQIYKLYWKAFDFDLKSKTEIQSQVGCQLRAQEVSLECCSSVHPLVSNSTGTCST